MPRQFVRTVAATAIALALAACGDRPRGLPTPPDAGPTRSTSVGASCARDDGTYLVDQVAVLFATSVQAEARRLARRVTSRCPDKNPALDYVQQILTWRRTPGLVVANEAAQWDYLQRLFGHIGFRIDNTADALGPQGFAAVCTNGNGCEAIAQVLTSGIKVFRGALGGALDNRFLVTGAPTACGAIDRYTDLQLWAQCVEVSVDPKPGPSFAFQRSTDPNAPAPAIVQTCLAESSYDLAQYLTGSEQQPILTPLPDGTKPRIRLAQRSGPTDDPTAPVKLRPRPGDGTTFERGFFVADCDEATAATASAAAGAGRLRLAADWAGGLGRAVGRLFAPATLYAAHGGLGSLPGLVEETSRFGPADPFVFEATFDNPYPNGLVTTVRRTPDVPGRQPVDDDLGRGQWSIQTEAPGSVLVRTPPFGDLAGSRLVVINQGGGASAGKLGVSLLANLAYFDQTQPGTGTRASAGKYRIRWTSLVATPRVGEQAPFVALAVDPAAPAVSREVARFEYVNGRNAQSGPIRFGGAVVPGLTWTQNYNQRFEILVDLTGDATGPVAYFRTVDGAGTPSAVLATQRFAAGLQLAQAGWRMTGRDNQIIGMDDFEIVRLADDYVVR